MKRKIYKTLIEWKEKRARREALLIDGARRVGKSWIAQEFACNEYESHIIINFSRLTVDQKLIFDNYINDTDEFLKRLQLISNTVLIPHKSLIIFDEVQLYPKAREAVKWLVADGRFDYLETGSLVSIRKNTKGIVLPSEEFHVDMWPMDFEEFMWATGNEMLMNFIKEHYESKQPLGNALHRKAMDLLRLYLTVGGMPQAVLEYIKSENFDETDHVKRSIIQLYRNDIYQYAGSDAAKVAIIWDSLPAQLQKGIKRFRVGSLTKGAKTRDYSEAFFWLNESRVVNTCYAASEPNIGMKLNRNDAMYKLYMGDTGLLISHAFSEEAIAHEQLYRKLMLGKLEINKGMLVENLVSQMLRASGYPLFFYYKIDRQNAEENMEIDFLTRKHVVTSRHNINAIEVKSTQRYTTSSLNKFEKKFSNYINQAIIIHSGDLMIKNNKLYLPLYMACLL